MNGRDEHDLSFKRCIDNILFDLPHYVTEWYYNLLASNKSIRTCYTYIQGLKDFLTSINSTPFLVQIDELTPAALDNYFIKIKNVCDKNGKVKRSSDSRITTTWFLLKNFFEFMVNRGYVKKNYVKDISCPKNKDLDRINEHRVLLTKEDFTKILQAAMEDKGVNQRRNVLIIELFMATGMRASALMEIDLKHVDLEKKRLYVVDKGEKRHEYVLSDKLIETFKNYYKQRELIDPLYKKEPLFINKQGQRISIMVAKTTIGKYTEKALGKKLSPHKLRAGFCSILYGEKHDIEFVRRAAGHSSSTTTQRYIVTNNIEREQASEIMDSIF